jgi:spermidine synthase
LPGGFLGSTRSITAFGGNGTVNTDDYPGIMFDAPGFVYDNRHETPDEIVEHLIDSFSADGHELFSAPDSCMTIDMHALRFNQYRQARDRFIRMGISFSHLRGWDCNDALIDSLFSFVQLSGDFESAYNPLLGIALQRYRTDPQMSLTMLRKLDTFCCQRNEVRSIIEKIEGRDATLNGYKH